MSLNVDRVQLEIVVGNDKARLKMSELEGDIKKTTSELKKLENQNKKNTAENEKLQNQLKTFNQQLDATNNQISKDVQKLEALRRENKENTVEFVALEKKIEKARATYKYYNFELANTRNKIQALKDAGRENSAENERLTNKLEQLKIEYNAVKSSMDITRLSMRELRQESSNLKLQLDKLDPKSDGYKNLEAKLKAINTRMSELRGSANESRTAIQKLADGFNRYESLLSSITLVFAALIYGANQFIQSMSDMSDVVAGVAKNTNLSIKEVKQLKSEFKDFDTRTGNKELLDIANQAGKLGIQGKENIKGFVKEANIAVVAFGRDLAGNAEDTINTLGRVIGAYRLNQELGWEESMRRVGSVINELGKSGTAQESNIVDYVSRLSAAGVALKVSYEDIAGIGATLDGLNVKSEMGATAVQKFMFTIVNKSAEMSRFLGVSVKDYKAMIEKDLVGTMLSILHTASQGNTGLQTMLQQIDAMDVSGERMTSTVLSLVNNVDVLEQQIQISNKAWKEGTSTMAEYNIANETFAARIEKAVKTIGELIFSLQSGLEPIILAVVEGTAKLAKYITENARAFVFIIKVIGVATTALVSYNLAVKLSEMWTKRAVIAQLLQKAAYEASFIKLQLQIAATELYAAAQALLAGNLKKAIASMRLFATTLAMNPVGLAVAAIGALTAAYFAFRTETEEVIDANKELKDSFAQSKSDMLTDFEILKRTTEGTSARSQAIQQINERYKEYLPNLLEESASLDQINIAQAKALENLEKQLKFEIKRGEIKKAFENEMASEKRMLDSQLALNKAYDEFNAIKTTTRTVTDAEAKMLERNYLLSKGIFEANLADLTNVQNERKKLFAEISSSDINNVPDKTFMPKTGSLTASLEELMRQLKELEAQKEKAAPGTGPWKDLSDEIDKTKKSIGEYLDLLYPDKAEFEALLDEVVLDIKKQFTTDDPVKIPIEVMPLENEDFTDKQTDYLVKKHAATLDGRRALNELSYQNDIISYAEYLDVKAELDKEADASKMERAKAFWQSTQNFMQAYSTYNNSRMEQELAAAGKNEAKQLAIKRKYARKQQQMDIITAGINQAMGIVEIWGKWGANPVVAGILTAIELAATGLQIAAIKSKQFAKGRYNVTGADDGRVYRNVPYIGPARTGIVRQPALISERGSEGIVDHRTLYSNVRDTMGMTPMDHFRAIAAIKYDRTAVPQFAEGRYTAASSFNPETSTSQAAQYASREELGAMVGMMSAYMQKVDAWQREFVVKNDPRSTMEEYDKYKSVENRSKG